MLPLFSHQNLPVWFLPAPTCCVVCPIAIVHGGWLCPALLPCPSPRTPLYNRLVGRIPLPINRIFSPVCLSAGHFFLSLITVALLVCSCCGRTALFRSRVLTVQFGWCTSLFLLNSQWELVAMTWANFEFYTACYFYRPYQLRWHRITTGTQ